MIDKEMLEWAAKAACIELSHWNDGSEPYSSGEGFILPSNRIWNPLTYDGDALRLAVRCCLRVQIWNQDYMHNDPHTHITYDMPEGKEGKVVVSAWDDPDAATRRAIVRAAAEIGKAMEG